MNKQLLQLQQTIGYEFRDMELLRIALTHSSYANEKHWDYNKNNERLEFLGDAVLDVLSSDFIFKNNAVLSLKI